MKNPVQIDPENETELGQLIQIEASKYNITLFRNNSGALKNPTGHPVRFGLGNTSKKINEIRKSSDYIGVTELLITPEMVGNTVAVFTALEIKETGWEYSGTPREVAQKNFIDLIIKKGGYASFINSVDSVKQLVLNNFRTGLK
jgi:hypothetical protein